MASEEQMEQLIKEGTKILNREWSASMNEENKFRKGNKKTLVTKEGKILTNVVTLRVDWKATAQNRARNNKNLIELLKEAHDKMDDMNADTAWPGEKAYCGWCKTRGYNSNGLIHDDSCILVRIRKALDGN